jgi:hypothetical protein
MNTVQFQRYKFNLYKLYNLKKINITHSQFAYHSHLAYDLYFFILVKLLPL